MIVTEQSMMLNFLKTGSSFVRKTRKQIHGYFSLSRRIRRKLGLPDGNGMHELR